MVLLDKIFNYMKKFLLSTGRSTSRVEYYIIDLFKLYLGIYPGDIPYNQNLGFNFSLTEVLKKNLREEVTNRLNNLVDRFAKSFGGSVTIGIDSIEIIDEKTVNLVITVNSISDNVVINIEEE